MSILAADLTAIFADTAISNAVVFGQQTCRGLLRSDDGPATDHAGGLVLTHQQTLTIRAGALTGLAEDSTITVDGTSYRVRQLQHVGPQGLLLKVVLA